MKREKGKHAYDKKKGFTYLINSRKEILDSCRSRDANLIGSWILSSSCNYDLRYKSSSSSCLFRLCSNLLSWKHMHILYSHSHETSDSHHYIVLAKQRKRKSGTCSSTASDTCDYRQVLITNLVSTNYN